jgi:hypothetical protein
MLPTLLADLVDDKDLVLLFLFVFSRFEYALKRTGYLTQKNKAEADWDAYSNHGHGKFANITDARFNNRRAYLLQQPPRTKVVSSSGGLYGLFFGSDRLHRNFSSAVDYRVTPRSLWCAREIS